jgi:hypothetical protein
MSVIKLRIHVSELETVLGTFNQIKVYRSTDGIAGTYSEITSVSTRIHLQAGKENYEYTDTAGAAEYFYRTSYFASGDSSESDLSAPRLGADPATDGILTTQELLDYYLFGIDLTNDAGEPYPLALYDWSIRYAISWLEHELDLHLRPTRITDERYDYWRRDYEEWAFFKLKAQPVIDDLTGADLTTLQSDLTRVRVMFPSTDQALEFDQRWIQIDERSGQINIVPTQGTLAQMLIGSGGGLTALLTTGRDFFPNLFAISYTAGFREGTVPRALRELIGKKASFGPLNIAGDLLGGAGIASQSIGMDGLSQSFNTTSSATNAGYGARLLQYGKEIKEQLETLKRYYRGIQMVVA